MAAMGVVGTMGVVGLVRVVAQPGVVGCGVRPDVGLLELVAQPGGVGLAAGVGAAAPLVLAHRAPPAAAPGIELSAGGVAKPPSRSSGQ